MYRGSPVRWTSDNNRVGTLTSSNAAAMSAVDVVNGVPE
jgi:hypothetical protein